MFVPIHECIPDPNRCQRVLMPEGIRRVLCLRAGHARFWWPFAVRVQWATFLFQGRECLDEGQDGETSLLPVVFLLSTIRTAAAAQANGSSPCAIIFRTPLCVS